MYYTIAKSLSNQHFKRQLGVTKKLFEQMVTPLKPAWRAAPTLGTKFKLYLCLGSPTIAQRFQLRVSTFILLPLSRAYKMKAIRGFRSAITIVNCPSRNLGSTS